MRANLVSSRRLWRPSLPVSADAALFYNQTIYNYNENNNNNNNEEEQEKNNKENSGKPGGLLPQFMITQIKEH